MRHSPDLQASKASLLASHWSNPLSQIMFIVDYFRFLMATTLSTELIFEIIFSVIEKFKVAIKNQKLYLTMFINKHGNLEEKISGYSSLSDG